VAFRGRNDNGDQATATWKALQNTNWTQAVDENFRVRLEAQETAGCAKSNFTNIQLQYRLNGGTWTDVTASSNVVRSSASPNEADAAALTDQLTVGTGTFEGDACFDEVNGVCGSTATDVLASGHIEAEYCVQILSADVTNNDVVELRITVGGTAFAAYDATPSITVSESAPVEVLPGVGALVFAGFAAVVSVSANVEVSPGTGELIFTGFAPTISVGNPVEVLPGTGALTITGFAPVVSVTENQNVQPGFGELVLAGFAPTIAVTNHQTVLPGLGEVTLAGFAPTVTVTENRIVAPGTGELVLAGFAPTVSTGANTEVLPATGELTLAGFAPTVTATANVNVTPGTGELIFTGFAPTVTGGGGAGVEVLPGTGEVVFTGFAPSVAVAARPRKGIRIYKGFPPLRYRRYDY